jgi:uncharacterized protein YidB (DUF937 family)
LKEHWLQQGRSDSALGGDCEAGLAAVAQDLIEAAGTACVIRDLQSLGAPAPNTVGDGPLLVLTSQHVRNAFGVDVIAQMALAMDLSADELAEGLSLILPSVIERMSKGEPFEPK